VSKPFQTFFKKIILTLLWVEGENITSYELDDRGMHITTQTLSVHIRNKDENVRIDIDLIENSKVSKKRGAKLKTKILKALPPKNELMKFLLISVIRDGNPNMDFSLRL
jgi:hypothetical protein